MLLKRVLKHKTSFICYFKFHDLYLFTFSRLKSLPCPSSTHFAGQLAHVIGPLKCYNDDYQCYDYQCYPRLPSYPRFTLSPGFYSHIRVLPSRPSVRPDIRPYIRPDIRPDIRPSIRPSIRSSVRIRVLPLPVLTACFRDIQSQRSIRMEFVITMILFDVKDYRLLCGSTSLSPHSEN